jgi:Fe2+ or Zn2+ uptake regulation protein
MSKAEEILKKNNLSVTDLRKSVIEFFIKKNRPITAKEFRKQKKFLDINESSIYRNLTKLVEAKIIHEVPGAGEFKYYELTPTGHHHHHHITCSKCKTVQCLKICGLEKRMNEMAKSVEFELVAHSVELVGLCKKCT